LERSDLVQHGTESPPDGQQLRESNTTGVVRCRLSYSSSNRSFATGPHEFFEELALARGYVFRQPRVNFGVQVASSVGLAQVRHALDRAV
jgi:hypothetical protein